VTEKEWLTFLNPLGMLEHLRRSRGHRQTPRKFRLLACAFCRLHWSVLEPASKKAVEIGERFADGRATEDELLPVRRAATADAAALRKAIFPPARASEMEPLNWADSAAATASPSAKVAVRHAVWGPLYLEERSDQRRRYAELLNHIIGNPFHPITINPGLLTWHGRLIVSMAQRMYDSRDFSAMPVLADALEEAGCQDQDILAHCRSEAVHVRGCWVLDLLLEKE
jgi:hypothetical protein